jgi:hypothetical protein
VVVLTITTYRKVGAFYIACNGDFSPTLPFDVNRDENHRLGCFPLRVLLSEAERDSPDQAVSLIDPGQDRPSMDGGGKSWDHSQTVIDRAQATIRQINP